MAICQNYFNVEKRIEPLLFTKTLERRDLSLNLRVKEVLDDAEGYYILNYYEFHVLLDISQGQNTIYHKLGIDFMHKFSRHKKLMFFIGYYNQADKTFTPTEIFYNMKPKNFGLYIKKNILKAFKEAEIHLMEVKYQKDAEHTKFKIL